MDPVDMITDERRVREYMVIANTTVFLYDYVLTLPSELSSLDPAGHR